MDDALKAHFVCPPCSAGLANDDWTWVKWVYSNTSLCEHGLEQHDVCTVFKSDAQRKLEDIWTWIGSMPQLERVDFSISEQFTCECCGIEGDYGALWVELG